MNKTLRILGIRGVPAAHGGFETFAEYLSLFLVKKGWKVIVYCQLDGEGETFYDTWEGIERVNIPITTSGAKGTVLFDWLATKHAAKHNDLCLTLGYNTAVFCSLLRIKNIPNVINMDGIEWKRQKWGIVAKSWFYINEIAGLWLGNHLVADHPGIKKHLSRAVSADKITMIPYGSETIFSRADDISILQNYSLIKNQYAIVIARPEPENSILEVVTAFSKLETTTKLVVLGNYKDDNLYHKSVLDSANANVVFLGAIYDKHVVQALRANCRFYVHGHQVGGTNPSLVEALGAGNPVLAHDNLFNRWVADDSALYFSDMNSCIESLSILINDDSIVDKLSHNARILHSEKFTWEMILEQYESLLNNYHR